LTLKLAKQHLRDLMADMELIPPPVPPAVLEDKGLTLTEFAHWETYQRNRGIAASTRGSHAATLKNHILPVFGETPIADVSPSHISGFFHRLNEKNLSPKSVVNIYQLLHVMFEVAAEHDLIENNPVRQKASPSKTPAQEDADLERRERSDNSARDTRTPEGSLLLYCAHRSSYWRTPGAAVEGYRLGCEDDNVRQGVLEGAAIGFHQDWSGTRPAYAGRS
jgi:hypothetical protein